MNNESLWWKTDGEERARVGVDTGYIGRVEEPSINEPNTITFNNVNSDWVMQITADRKIIVNEDVEVSEAAKVVLELVQQLLDKAQLK